MERITTKKQLLENIENIRAVEILARKGYEEDIFTFKNFELTSIISRIKIDEDKHIAILDELIKMLKG
jgi:rubrerythrin